MNGAFWLVAGSGWSYCWLSVFLTARYAPPSHPHDTQ